MKNLFLFLWRFKYFILFLVLEIFCFFLIYQNSNFHHAAFVNSSNTVAANVNESVKSLKDYLNLKKVNGDLASENARLRSMLKDAYYSDTAARRNITDTVNHQQYSFIAAKVINNSVNRRNNYLTLDVGSLQGVQSEMGVVCSEGLVGIVKDVSPHFCSVMSFLHKDSKISAKVQKSGYIGSLIWDGYSSNRAELKDIALHVQLAKGDSIVTSSYSSIFPEGIMLGWVDEVEKKAGDNFYKITVRLSTDFSKLTYVYVINNVLKEEQKKIEEEQQKNVR
jgi:rod shape-determining protein MreC